MVTGLWYNHDPNFGPLPWFWRCKEHPCHLSPYLGIWRMLKVSDWGLASWSWFGYSHWSLTHPCSKFWLSVLILKAQRTSMSFKSLFEALEVPDWGLGSWYGDWSLIHLCPNLLKFSFASAMFQLRYLLSTAQKDVSGGVVVRPGSAKTKDQSSANQNSWKFGSF